MWHPLPSKEKKVEKEKGKKQLSSEFLECLSDIFELFEFGFLKPLD